MTDVNNINQMQRKYSVFDIILEDNIYNSIEDSNKIPKYMLPGINIIKSVNMVNTLERLEKKICDVKSINAD